MVDFEKNERDCPWPGPVPYSEAQAEEFLGRSAEVSNLLDHIERQRLNVLIALSGVGKSSLLQAGLIPALRYMREETGEIGPVLLAREWARLGEASPAALLAHSIRRSIETLSARNEPKDSRRLKEDAKLLLQVSFPKPEDFGAGADSALRALVGYVQRLCEATGELVLILDQVEELLGSGLFGPDQGVQYGVLRVIGVLFEREKRLRLLLSLREEFLASISSLARDVEGLEKRIIRLNPMPRDTVKDILKKASDISEQRIGFESEKSIETLLGWLGERQDGSENPDGNAPVDLFRLQVLLISIFRYARKQSTAETIVIDDSMLQCFKDDLIEGLKRESPDREIPDSELARRGLEMYIELLLRDAEVEEPPSGPGHSLMKRVLIRMPAWLSSPGGFKRHIAAEDLIFNAIRDDLEVLNPIEKPDRIRGELLEFYLAYKVAKDREGNNENLSVGLHFERLDASSLSGQALMHSPPWSLFQAATMLARAAVEVLELLCDKYVLKASQGRATVTYELVHDGFGRALFEWAERERMKLSDTLASIVSRRGETFRWPDVQNEILEQVSWLGCSLNDKTFSSVRFTDCVLSGSVFLQCTLKQCTFERCDLRGVVFLGGAWENVQIRSCVGNSVLIRGTAWSEVSIESSVLDNSTFADIELCGKVAVADCSLQFSQIQKFRIQPNAPTIEIQDTDLQNSLLEERRTNLSEDCNENGVLRKKPEAIAPRRGSLASGEA
jgi:uncharacterized protein YjbI with pentapeptide repeats